MRYVRFWSRRRLKRLSLALLLAATAMFVPAGRLAAGGTALGFICVVSVVMLYGLSLVVAASSTPKRAVREDENEEPSLLNARF
jgi:hypothetical protein